MAVRIAPLTRDEIEQETARRVRAAVGGWPAVQLFNDVTAIAVLTLLCSGFASGPEATARAFIDAAVVLAVVGIANETCLRTAQQRTAAFRARREVVAQRCVVAIDRRYARCWLCVGCGGIFLPDSPTVVPLSAARDFLASAGDS